MAEVFDKIEAILVGIVTGGALVYSALKSHRLARKIQDTQRSKASSAPQGYIEVEGFAWPMSSAFETSDGGKCVYYTFELQKEIKSDKNTEWKTIYTRKFENYFYLVDATGLLILTPVTAEINLDSHRCRGWGSLSDSEKDTILHKIIDRPVAGFSPLNFLTGMFSGSYRIIESYIKVGAPIYANGDFQTNNGELKKVKLPGLTKFCAQVFDSTSGKLKNRSKLSENNNAQVSLKQSSAYYVEMSEMTTTAFQRENTDEKEFTVYGTMKSNPQHTLFIADAHEVHLVKRLSRFMWPKLVGGAAMITLALGMMIVEFGWYSKFNKTDIAQNKPVLNRSITSTGIQFARSLHHSCVNGDVTSCQALLVDKDKFQLGERRINYYKQQACRLGSKEHCL